VHSARDCKREGCPHLACLVAAPQTFRALQVMIQVGIQKARLPALCGAPAALQALVDRCTAADAAARPDFAAIEAELSALADALPAGGRGAAAPAGGAPGGGPGGGLHRSRSVGTAPPRPGRPALGTLGEV